MSPGLRILLIATAAMSIGCRALGDPGESSFGDQCTSSTEVYGCVDITGSVTNQSGFPLEDIDVGPAAGSDTHGLETKFVNTGADGIYELRLFQRDPNAPASFQLSLKATQRDNTGTEVKSRIISVQVTQSVPDDYPDPVVVNFVIQ